MFFPRHHFPLPLHLHSPPFTFHLSIKLEYDAQLIPEGQKEIKQLKRVTKANPGEGAEFGEEWWGVGCGLFQVLYMAHGAEGLYAHKTDMIFAL